MGKCEKCVTDKSNCDRCKDNPKYADYPKVSFYSEYISLCPQGYKDCVYDPAYIKHHYPEWYEDMWRDKTPEEIVKEKCDPDDKYCYDDEDK